MGLLDRIAARINRRVEPTAVAMGATDAGGPTQAPDASGIAAGMTEVGKLQRDEDAGAETERQEQE